MNATTDAQPRAISTGLAAIAYAELAGIALPDKALAAVANHDLLAFVFGQDEEPYRPILASFTGNPKAVEHSAWAARAWFPDISVDAPEANNYMALNRYEAMRGSCRADWHFSRREMQARSMYGLLLDDVVDWRALGLPPTWVIETSPGSFQAVYLFDEPLEGFELMVGKALGAALIEKGWSDPAAGSPTTRFMRLPVGINGKTTPPSKVALRFLAPANRYSVGELVTGLALALKAFKPFVKPPPPERLAGELGEIQQLVERIDAQRMDRDHWIGFMHALRGAVGAAVKEGEALAVQASWNASEHEIRETLRAWRTIDTQGLRSGIEELRRLATHHPDPTTVFGVIEEDGAGSGGGGSQALLHASARDAQAALAAAAAGTAGAAGAGTAGGGEFAVLADTPRVAAMSSYIIKGVYQQSETMLLYGASGSAKTFMVVDMAVHLAGAREWFGHKVAQGIGVVIVANEDAPGVQERLHAAAAQLELPVESLPVAFTLVPTNMRGDEHEASARVLRMRRTLIARFPGVTHVVVIFDTLAATWAGLDDNSPEGMGEVTAHCASAKAAGMSPMLVHHLGKDASKGARGHSSLWAAVDAALLLSYDVVGRLYSMLVTKRRKGPTGKEWNFSLQEVTIGVDSDGDDISTAVIKREDEMDSAVSAGEARRRAARQLPPGVVVVQQALYKAVAEAGVVHDAGPVHGVHQAVEGETWKATYLAGKSGSTRQERNTALQAFTRGRDRLLAEGHVGEHQGLFWLP